MLFWYFYPFCYSSLTKMISLFFLFWNNSNGVFIAKLALDCRLDKIVK